MATSMIRRIGTCKLLRSKRFHEFYRNILSNAYKSDQLWKERLNMSFLEKIDAKKFGIQLLDRFEKEKNLTSIDVELFANKLQDLDSDFEYIAREILLRYRHCDTSVPIQDKIMHAIVRGYIDGGFVTKLIPLIKDKWQYGVFPDNQSMCLLIDHLLESKNYQDAAQVAYEVMLQEEYDCQLKNVLALSAAVKHYCHTMDFERRQRPPVDPDEEIEYIPIKVIRNIYYDDHFDIKDERFLLGKTLYYLSKNTEMLDPIFARSLQLIGLGLYEKFELANQHLTDWLQDGSTQVVYSEAIKMYEDCLASAPTRDPDAEPVSMGDKTMDDEIELLRLTPEEKGDCITKFKNLTSSLTEDKTPSGNLEQLMDKHLSSSEFKTLEKDESVAVASNYKKWFATMGDKFQRYKSEIMKQKKLTEIHDKLDALKEREELLRYFEHADIIGDFYKKRSVEEEETVTEEYVEAPGQRNIKLKLKKRK